MTKIQHKINLTLNKPDPKIIYGNFKLKQLIKRILIGTKKNFLKDQKNMKVAKKMWIFID